MSSFIEQDPIRQCCTKNTACLQFRRIRGWVRDGAGESLCTAGSEVTGGIARATVRAVWESAGIKDILTKSFGSETPLNVVRATMMGMESMISEEMIAESS